jgi:hypothetical protein
MYQSSPRQNSSTVEQYSTYKETCLYGQIKVVSFARTARVSAWLFDVSVSRTGSMTSNDGMRDKVSCRCVGRRPINFETEICYLDFKD